MANKPWTLDAQHQTHHAYLSGEPIHTLANLFHQSVMCMRQAGAAKPGRRCDSVFGLKEIKTKNLGIYLA